MATVAPLAWTVLGGSSTISMSLRSGPEWRMTARAATSFGSAGALRLMMNEADPRAGVGAGLGNQAVQGPGFEDLGGKGRGRRAGLRHGGRPAQSEDEAGRQDPEERRPGHLSQ